ncbi:hypothetical protein [Nocardia jejuensis]|uniref:hypothetical protein n=1 Tax=Nocardia jejuensis TaxID=328049 RepID=UPI00083761E2|nr:hypothetical protein [Nocardia jejuensis]
MSNSVMEIRDFGDGLRGIVPRGSQEVPGAPGGLDAEGTPGTQSTRSEQGRPGPAGRRDAPVVLDAVADPDVMVLEVAGGYLTWNVLAGQLIPAAVIDDPELAQEWVWALYGERVALALDAHRTPSESPAGADGVVDEMPAGSSAGAAGEADAEVARAVGAGDGAGEVADGVIGSGPVDGAGGVSAGELWAEPGSPALAASAWRLAYAHWASRWWPASTLDSIAPLDSVLLDREIAALTEECESLVDGADAVVAEAPASVETFPRASDYALAAGEGDRGGMVLARGAGGWDWRRCPPGLVDASERAVSWQVVRDAGVTTVAVSAVAAPGGPADLPAYLRPWARIHTAGGVVDAELRSVGGAWVGEAFLPTVGRAGRVDLYLPGFGVAEDTDPAAPELRREIREFASARLRYAAEPADDRSPSAPLLAEIAAAAEDSDF